jgi:hypothetical protein
MAVPGAAKRTNPFELQGTSLNIDTDQKSAADNQRTVAVQHKCLAHNKRELNSPFYGRLDYGYASPHTKGDPHVQRHFDYQG